VRLLLITFEIDAASPVLAWQAGVAAELAKHCDQIVVVTHRIGVFQRPDNADVYCFPAFLQRAPWRWLGSRYLTNVFIWKLWKRHRFDGVFIHMNMEWAYRLYPTFRLLGVPVVLWYAHGSVSYRLRLAHLCVRRVLTSTPEGFRLPSHKVRVIGQGVDTKTFSLQVPEAPQGDIVTVSRLSRRKRIELVIEALTALVEMQPDEPFRLRIIGSALTEADRSYEESLKELVRVKGLSGLVDFTGHVPSTEIPRHYRSAFVHVNVSQTGSMDKTVLESMACGCPVLTSNEALFELLRPRPEWILTDVSPRAIATRVLDVYRRRRSEDREAVRRLVTGRHDLTTYARRIVAELSAVNAAAGATPATEAGTAG
jgi:glycosyltransferase involved in cell wall biosynthesis